MNKDRVSEKEAAEFLGVSKSTVIRLRNSKQIECYHIGRRITYDVEKHLVEFLERCEQKSIESAPIARG